MDRKKASIILSILVFLLSIPSTLSYGPWSNIHIFGKSIFDFFDFMTSNVCLPIVGILECIFVGWVWGIDNAVKEITSDGKYQFKIVKVYGIIIKYVAPIAILLIFLNSTGLIKF